MYVYTFSCRLIDWIDSLHIYRNVVLFLGKRVLFSGKRGRGLGVCFSLFYRI